MIIEDAEALKSWLSKLLEPICEADPAALSNYVVALVKKDKPEKELKALCADQLDVFLQNETNTFVDKLFESLTTKKYLETPAKEVSKETKPTVEKLVEKEGGRADRDRNSQKNRSPLRNRSDFNESRVRDDRRIDDRKQRGVDHLGKTAEPHREHHDRRVGSYSRSRSKGKSKEGECSRGREYRTKFDQERKDPEGSGPTSVSACDPLQKWPHPPTPLLPLPHAQHPPSTGDPAVSSSATVVVPAHLSTSTTESRSSHLSNCSEDKPLTKSTALKQRCSNYDRKGFCVRGDLCPFDHGSNPLVVDEVTLPAMMQFPPLPDRPPSQIAPPPHGQAPLLDTFPMPGNYGAEAYNPEVMGIIVPGQPQYQQFIPRVQTQRPNLIGLTSRDQDTPISRAANIVIQTEPPVSAVPNNDPKHSGEQESRKRPLGASDGPLPKKPWMEKKNFNSQNSPSFQKKNHYANTKLEVRKIPRDLNNITKLNEHFSTFGSIVNIQVAFGGDPEAALIQYTMNEEARRAISSTEAVLNNRFIRVHWHWDSNSQQLHQPQGQSHSAPSGPACASVPKVVKTQYSPGAYVLNKTAAKHPTLSVAGSKPAAWHIGSDPSLAMTTSVNLQKGAYSSPVMKSTSKPVGKSARALEAQEAMQKKQEALRLQQDMRKVKQEMLEKQIECQKVLINRLERNKAMKPEKRANIMKTLKELSEKISRLKDEMKPASVSTAGSAQAKNKTDAQKELLDAELDFYKQLSSGEDTTDLKRRLSQLQVEATHFGLIPTGRGKGPPARGHGRGKGQGRNARGRGGGGHLVVDHRPRALAILGISSEEKDELMPHFVKFGEIEELREHDTSSIVMTFRTRGEAENAANQGAKFKGRTLQMSWYKPETVSASMEPEKEEPQDKGSTSSILLPEEDDDDEEDEYESRSWRR